MEQISGKCSQDQKGVNFPCINIVNKIRSQYSQNKKMFDTQYRSDPLADCLQFANLKKLNNIDLKTISDEVEYLKFKAGKSDSSLFFKKLNNNMSSNKSSSQGTGSSSQNSRNSKPSENPEDISSLFQGIISYLKRSGPDESKKKVVVPSLLRRSSITSKNSLESNMPQPDSSKMIMLNKKNESISSHPVSNASTTSSKRRVRDINWPVQLQPSEDQRSQKTASELL